MPYTFKIAFPGDQSVTLSATCQTEAEVIERALVELNADYTVCGPGWIGGSLRMTAEGLGVLDRLAPSEAAHLQLG